MWCGEHECQTKGLKSSKFFALKSAFILFILGGVLDVSGDTFEIFYDSFESPVVTNRFQCVIPGWSGSATTVGLWNEGAGTMVTPWGSQAAYVSSTRNILATNLTEKLTLGATYTLTFNAAAENGLGGIKYKAELLAGTNILTSVTAATTLTNSNFSARSETLQYVVPQGHFALGQKLGIRLSYASGSTYVLGFDNVRLIADEVAERKATLFYGK
jgi:hypothetical protein